MCTKDLVNHMNDVRKAVIQESAGVTNGNGTPIVERQPFKVFTRMITPGDVLAVCTARDVNTIGRGLRAMIRGAKVASLPSAE